MVGAAAVILTPVASVVGSIFGIVTGCAFSGGMTTFPDRSGVFTSGVFAPPDADLEARFPSTELLD